ncbi:MAG: Flagellar assembly protein FliH, partial [Chlamydiales bacterium]|nr:Flagellar assembly protein FliH [Chlamydiales bacterium]
SNKIIRGAVIDGTVCCSPRDSVEPSGSKSQESLDALEQFWSLKGLEEGKKKGFAEGILVGEQEGESRGRSAGLLEGKEAGFQEGYDKGLIEGKESALEELKTLFASLNSSIEAVGRERISLLTHAKGEIIQMTVAMAEKIFPQLLLEEGRLVKMLDHLIETIKPMSRNHPLEIALSTEDYELLLKQGLEEKETKFFSDKTLPRGNIRLETPLGLLNFDMKRMLKDLEVRLLEVSEAISPEDAIDSTK